jgi:Putative Ig domain
MNRPMFAATLLASLASAAPALPPPAQTVVELEPNGTPAAANAAALGDSLRGEISSRTDSDYFALDIPGGTFVQIPSTTTLLVCLQDQGGVSVLVCGVGGLNFPITTGGRYFVLVRARIKDTHTEDESTFSGPYAVQLQAEHFTLGAGDPVRPLANLPTAIFNRIAAGLHGELYAASSQSIVRIDPNGSIKTLVSSNPQHGSLIGGDIVVDAFGDILAPRPLGNRVTVSRISPDGTLSTFADLALIQAHPGTALAVGPDGDIWIATQDSIIRLGPTGAVKEHLPLNFAEVLAVSPAGDVYYVETSNPWCEQILVVQGRTRTCAFPDGEWDWAPIVQLQFGSDGRLYRAAASFAGYPWLDLDPLELWAHVDVFLPGDPTPHPLAHVPYLRALTFLRDAQGNMTSRLVALQRGGDLNRIVEFNGPGRPPGAGFAVRFFHATLDSLPLATFGLSYLQALRISSDSTGHTWSVENGMLPPGLTLSTDGVLKGVPTALGSYAFTVRATSGLRSWFAPGTISVRGDLIDVSQIVAALLGGPALSPTQVQLLDHIGNKNGILDTGDLRAYLRSMGLLTPN